MQRVDGGFRPVASVVRAVIWTGGALAGVAAGAIAAVLAVFFAAAMMVIAFMASILLALAAMAAQARRRTRASFGADIIEARRVGGHSWVAYGWDQSH